MEPDSMTLAEIEKECVELAKKAKNNESFDEDRAMYLLELQAKLTEVPQQINNSGNTATGTGRTIGITLVEM
jgi:hypothetical protein